MAARRVARRQYLSAQAIADNILRPVVLGRFKWSGLPYGLTSEQLERFITCWSDSSGFVSGGLALVFKDPKAGPVILPAYPADNLSLYYLPTKFIVTGVDYQALIDADNSVPIYNDASRQPLSAMIADTAQRLYDLMEISRANTAQQKNPFVFAGSPDEIKTLQAANDRREVDPGGIICMTERAMGTVETAKRFFPIKPAFESDVYYDYYLQIYNRFLTMCGMDNIAIQKRERLISAEAASNNQLIRYYKDTALRFREESCEAANKMFGLSLGVEWKGGENNVIQQSSGSAEPGV